MAWSSCWRELLGKVTQRSPLPWSLCFSRARCSFRLQRRGSTAPGDNTGPPAGLSSDSSSKVRGSVCTTALQSADTLGKHKGGLSLELFLRSPWDSSSTFAPEHKEINKKHNLILILTFTVYRSLLSLYHDYTAFHCQHPTLLDHCTGQVGAC